MAKRYSDSTLLRCTKAELIEFIRIAEHNEETMQQQLNQQYENVKDWMPVVHGQWDIEVGMNWFNERICSECKKIIRSNYWNKCPNCGAKMDGDE